MTAAFFEGFFVGLIVVGLVLRAALALNSHLAKEQEIDDLEERNRNLARELERERRKR